MSLDQLRDSTSNLVLNGKSKQHCNMTCYQHMEAQIFYSQLFCNNGLTHHSNQSHPTRAPTPLLIHTQYHSVSVLPIPVLVPAQAKASISTNIIKGKLAKSISIPNELKTHLGLRNGWDLPCLLLVGVPINKLLVGRLIPRTHIINL